MQKELTAEYGRLLEAEMVKLNQIVACDISKLTTALAKRNILDSALGVRLLAEPALKALPIFVTAAVKLLQNLIRTTDGSIGVEQLANIKQLLDDHVVAELDLLRSVLLPVPSTRRVSFREEAQLLSEELYSVAIRERERVDRELSLIAVANDRSETTTKNAT